MCCEGHFFVAGVFRCGGNHPFHGCLPQRFTEYLYPELLWVVQHAHKPLHTGLLVEEIELERSREAGGNYAVVRRDELAVLVVVSNWAYWHEVAQR